MKHPEWTKADSRTCKQIWAEYQKQHDITDRIGQTAGIDPKSGQIWFGDSIQEIVQQRQVKGLTSPLFLNASAMKPIFGKEIILKHIIDPEVEEYEDVYDDGQ